MNGISAEMIILLIGTLAIGSSLIHYTAFAKERALAHAKKQLRDKES